ncbi:MAG TPA: methyltransferase domain-containing protein [Puia sp.]|nr:methyltransferase domain-containing protein [Puia sp.]
MINEPIVPQHHPASFKDPSGFIFKANGKLYRQINTCYADDYDLLMSSGLYKALIEKKLLIPHTEINENFYQSPDWFKTILPEQLTFISYPYEWSFDELKDAALTTLRILKISVKHGMILKDGTSFNIQFHEGRAVFIDTLSFEKYDENKPWIAYRQFCECFLFPLLIEHYHKIDVQKLLSVYLEGIPAGTTAKLLPLKSRFKLGIWLHVYLQASVNAKNKPTSKTATASFSKNKLLNLIDSLQNIIKPLKVETTIQSTWNNYYEETILSKNYLQEKEKIFRELIGDINNGRTMDVGCNDGYFSKILAENNPDVIAVDFDSQCVNKLYLDVKAGITKNILPFCIDLTNPSPALGFNHAERQSFAERAKSDTITALALIHHIVLSKNVPFADVAKMFSDITLNHLIIEFVPITDEKSQQLIANKTTYHKPYDPEAFEKNFTVYFQIERKEIIPGTERILYRMKKLL